MRIEYCAVLIALAGAAACGSSTGEPDEPGTDAVRVIIGAGPSTLDITDTLALQAVAVDSAGRPVDSIPFVWSSSVPAVASVSAVGLVRANAVGEAVIRVQANGLRDSILVTVPIPVAEIQFRSARDSVIVDETFSMSVRLVDSSGNEIPESSRTIHYITTDQTLLPFAPEGAFVAIAPGTVDYVVRVGPTIARRAIRVLPRATSVRISNVPPTLFIADSAAATAVAYDSLGNALAGRAFEWSSSGGASVTQDGTTVGVEGGPATVRATVVYNRRGSSTVTPATTTAAFAVRLNGDVIHVAGGYNHGCFLSNTARAYCAGLSYLGQLGSEFTTMGPRAVSGDMRWSALTAGQHASCGLTLQGEPWCWGANDWGQLGTDVGLGTCVSGPCAITPVMVSGGPQFASLHGRWNTMCGLTAAGQAWCWGANTVAQLGIGSADGGRHPTPQAVQQGALSFTTVVSGFFLSCALDGGGYAWCWGGLPNLNPMTHPPIPFWTTPTRLTDTLTFQLLSASARVCGVTTKDRVVCWGDRIGDTMAAAVEIALPGPVRRVAIGGVPACAILTDGRTFCWGQDGEGERGDGLGATPSGAPATEVSGGFTFTSVDAGYDHACGISPTQGTWCWGDNGDFQLGIGEPMTRFIPTKVAGQP